MLRALSWHKAGNLGELCPEDVAENERGLREGFRLLLVYRSTGGVKFWIITGWDRFLTTVLLPEEY